VSLHLKFDNQTATSEHKETVIASFIQRCMGLLNSPAGKSPSDTVNDKKAVTQLLSLFLDRYEGIRPLKLELSSYARLTNIKPLEIDVINSIDPENRTMLKLTISYF